MFFFASRRRHTRYWRDWSSDVCSSDLATLAGVVPGGPGHSHQSVRDISAIGSVPGLTAFEPCSEREARLAIRWAVEVNDASTYLRFVNVPLDLPYALPAS